MNERKPSIVDKLTPLQAAAWEAEHAALEVEKSGYGAFKSYHLDIAEQLRTQDTENKIQALFDRSDAQNALLDGIASIKARGAEIPIFTPTVDYSLLEQ